jgi:DNA-binding protein H-NS
LYNYSDFAYSVEVTITSSAGHSMSRIASMTVDALLKLRDEIGVALSRKANELKAQLSRLGDGDKVGNGRRRGGPNKVAPKYRSPNGETWAGRGAQPRWLTAEVKNGKKREDFLIEKSAKKPARKRTVKRRAGKKKKAA